MGGALAAIPRPQIFSQEDQKSRRLLGITQLAKLYGATASKTGRWGAMPKRFEDRSAEVIAACIEVHREMGPGLLEALYEECLCRELSKRGLSFERQKTIVVAYKGEALDRGYRADLIVEKSLLVETKAVEALLPIHVAQTVTYLRLCKLDAGLLVNFNAVTIRAGLRRVFRHPQDFCPSDLPVKNLDSAERPKS
jgi:GxxExxY protein